MTSSGAARDTMSPAFDQPQREALGMLLLRLHDHQITAAEILWGGWLFPLAILVYRSRFLPRLLGVWLVVNGLAYIAVSFTGVASRTVTSEVSVVPCTRANTRANPGECAEINPVAVTVATA